MLHFVVPYQVNGWDCGVFVCRYAFGVLALRNIDFQFDGNKPYFSQKKKIDALLKTKITNGPQFDFDMEDIHRLRQEFTTLIDNLSEMYIKKEKIKYELKQKAKKTKLDKLGNERRNEGGEFV